VQNARGLLPPGQREARRKAVKRRAADAAVSTHDLKPARGLVLGASVAVIVWAAVAAIVFAVLQLR
jgi:hypothetical protein